MNEQHDFKPYIDPDKVLPEFTLDVYKRQEQTLCTR